MRLDETANRPHRGRRPLSITVGPAGADLIGSDDRVLQAGVEYLHRLGGGTLKILPGTYRLRNAIHLRPSITLEGSGETTVLAKTASRSTPLAVDSDWFEWGVQVRDPSGFAPGDGVMLRSRTGPGDWQFEALRATVTTVEGPVVYLDRLTEKNFWTERSATLETVHPLLTAVGVDDVTVRDLVLDGGRAENAHVNGNFSGALFLERCNRWRLERVTARDYNGDGFSFQVCDDIELLGCRALGNADLGFHPGSGSQRPRFRDCVATGNSQGIYFCWAVSDGLAERCVLSHNTRYGVSIGHRDTDNRIAGCTIEGNGEVGVLFRDEGTEFRNGHRNIIEGCTIRDGGAAKPAIGIDIQGRTRDLLIRSNTLRCATGIRVGPDADRVGLTENTFVGCRVPVEDLRAAT